jgi:hypothetical protein
MSKIPFVRALGDELERTAAERIASRRSRLRRRLTGGTLAIAVLAVGTAAASGVFSSEQLATTSIACYDGPGLDSGAAVVAAGDRSPVETCLEVLHRSGPLTACAAPEHVAVLPGGPEVCRQAGLEPLPDTYVPARSRVTALAHEIEVVERSSDCLPPAKVAERVQALLDRSGWTGWKADVRSDVSQGPCGMVNQQGGDGRWSIEGSLNADENVIYVFPGPSYSLTELLYGAKAPLAAELEDHSRERCFSGAELRDVVRERVARTGRELRLIAGSGSTESVAPGPGPGCAIVAEVVPAADGRGIEVAIRE